MSLNMAKIIKDGEDWELQLKKEVFDFIKSSFTLDVYEDHLQLHMFAEEFSEDYESFMENNKRCIYELDGDEINFYYYLYKNIEKGKVNTIYSEPNGCNNNEAVTFYFNINGEFIIY